MTGTPTAEGSSAPLQDDLIARATLCLPHFEKDILVHGGEEGFKDVLRQYFPSAESNASERLVNLKYRLRNASTQDFWSILLEEMCDITGSQCGFFAKRMLVDDADSAVEMPELGEPGSCLMGVALYLNNGADVKKLHHDYKYQAYGTPCAHMRHDKVFIIPERMSEFIRNNPNPFPWKQSEAYIGLPLCHEGKCFGHFGMIWSSEGAKKRNLSWPFIEMFMHSLEDMILQRILDGRGFAKEESIPAKVIPLSAVSASQSLKPYARSLSHELRTPMQGVVGMLDIMYSTVLDAIHNRKMDGSKSIFHELKNYIEDVQDSSRRAVEAADNVVHAYDLNMQMPETPMSPSDADIKRTTGSSTVEQSPEQSPSMTFETLSPPRIKKRERVEELDFHPGPPLKRMYTITETETLTTFDSVEENLTSGEVTMSSTTVPSAMASPALLDRKKSPSLPPLSSNAAHTRIVTRDFMRTLIHQALKNGHPTREIHNETDLGELIEVQTIGTRGETQDRIIQLEIALDVPEIIITEELHLQFALQKLVDNAIKFTEEGRITITVKMNKGSEVIEIWVVDTGCGIAEESKSNLFKPHFQEDSSLSRARDGLGLSLFNAKAHVRKNLGGDVTLERSDTEGSLKGSEFLIRLPISFAVENKAETPLNEPPAPQVSHDVEPPCPSGCGERHASKNCTKNAPSGYPEHTIPHHSSRKRATINRQLASEYPLNILIAEDNAINRNVAVGSLNKLGYCNHNITVAFDGLEAVKQYKSSIENSESRRFDAILMDIWMPNMDGYEATAKIIELAKEAGNSVKIIAVTADITGDCVKRAKDAGMEGFLAKPYKVFDIERLIIEHFPKTG